MKRLKHSANVIENFMLNQHLNGRKVNMFFKLLVICVSIQFSKYVDCFTECIISNSTVRCKGDNIASNEPSREIQLFLKDSDFSRLKTLENVSHVQKLDITATEGIIWSRCFYRLSNLLYLGLHVKENIFIFPDAFEGLNLLQTLNLSSNPRLFESFVSKALNTENRIILPNLVHLSISKIKTSVTEPVDLNYDFFNSITAGRSLKSLDISNLNIFDLNLFHIRPACRSIEYIDLRKSVIGSVTDVPVDYSCKSLRKLDMSGMILPVLRTKFSFQIFNFFCQSLKFYEHLNIFLVDNVNTEQYVDLTDYSLDMVECPLELQKVSVVGNRIRWLNITVHLDKTFIKKFTELNISNNDIEYISQSVLLPTVNLLVLDISNNKLHIMQEQYTDEFDKLFRAQEKLECLYLSHNGLSHFPMNTFAQNKFLRILDISYNNIEKIDFSISQLVYLEKLFAHNNKIRFIEPNVRNVLQKLLPSVSNVIGGLNKSEFIVYLGGNGFECTCDKEHKDFMKWIHVSEVIDPNENISCILDGRTVDVMSSAVTETETFCRIETIKKIATISVPLLVAILILVIVITIYARRWHRNKMLIHQVISQIEMGTFAMPYLVFLSYCSEDSELVLNTIYPKLLDNLSEITHSNQKLVCIGDKQFRPGFPLLCEIMRCIEESSVCVAVVSRVFCQKRLCVSEIKEACEQNKPIILLMVEHVEREIMEDFLQKIFDRYAHARWQPDENGGHIEPDWKIFCKSILQLSGTVLTKDSK